MLAGSQLLPLHPSLPKCPLSTQDFGLAFFVCERDCVSTYTSGSLFILIVSRDSGRMSHHRTRDDERKAKRRSSTLPSSRPSSPRLASSLKVNRTRNRRKEGETHALFGGDVIAVVILGSNGSSMVVIIVIVGVVVGASISPIVTSPSKTTFLLLTTADIIIWPCNTTSGTSSTSTIITRSGRGQGLL